MHQSDYLEPPKRGNRPKCYNSRIETESKLSITRNILDTSKRCCGSEQTTPRVITGDSLDRAGTLDAYRPVDAS